MTTDARTKYTKGVVRDALLELLKQKPIEKVTVKEISDLAGINRATFYRHYQDQYALLEEMEEEILEEIRNRVLECGGDRDERIRQMVSLLYENREEWTVLLGQNADSRIPAKIAKTFYRVFQDHDPSQEETFRYRFMMYGYAGTLADWIRGGMKEAPEAVAEKLTACCRALG